MSIEITVWELAFFVWGVVATAKWLHWKWEARKAQHAVMVLLTDDEAREETVSHLKRVTDSFRKSHET